MLHKQTSNFAVVLHVSCFLCDVSLSHGPPELRSLLPMHVGVVSLPCLVFFVEAKVPQSHGFPINAVVRRTTVKTRLWE